MKKNALVVFGLVAVMAFAGTGFGMNFVSPATSFVSENAKITEAEARKIALKRVEGKVIDEYTYENDEGEIETYVYIIKRKDNKTFEVQVDAEKGDIVSVEEYEEEESEDPPAFRR